MKKYILPLMSAVIFFSYGLQSGGIFGGLCIFISLMVCVAASKTVFEVISSFALYFQKKASQVRTLATLLNQMSQLEPVQVQHFLELSHGRTEPLQNYPIKPSLGLVDFRESLQIVSPMKEIAYQSKHVFSDLQKIEEEVSKLPLDESKLVLFVSENKQTHEADLIGALNQFKIPEFAVQHEIFDKADVIEVSSECFYKNRDLFFRLEQIFDKKYHHFLFLYPEQKSPKIQNKSKVLLRTNSDL